MKISLTEAIEAQIQDRLNNVNTCLPGRVMSFSETGVDASLIKLEVKPLLARRYINGEIVEPPIISDVPLVLPRTANSMFYIPVKPFDQVLLLFGQRDLGLFLEGDDGNAFYEPESRRKYNLNDAIAIPGFYSFNTGVGEVPLEEAKQNSDDVQIIHTNTKIKLSGTDGIEIKTNNTTLNIDNNGEVSITGDITISGAATVSGNLEVTGNIEATEVTASGVNLTTHVHGGVQTGGGTTGAPV